MKKVLLTPKVTVPVAYFEDCDPQKYYGLIYQGARGFLTRNDLDVDRYTWKAMKHFNRGNYFVKPNLTFKEAVNHACCNNIELFEFDSAEELLIWAAGKT